MNQKDEGPFAGNASVAKVRRVQKDLVGDVLWQQELNPVKRNILALAVTEFFVSCTSLN